jgi:hypothetical protein
MKTSHKSNLRAAGLLVLPGLTLLLVAQQINSLSIAGKTGSARVVHVSGRNYVELEGLARLVNGSISFHGDQIVLTLAGSGAEIPASAPDPGGFSKDFVTAGIEVMAELREWRAALQNSIVSGVPISANWIAPLRSKAQQALGVASVSATTAADRNALPFLTGQFNNVGALSDKYLQMTLSMSYIDPRSLDNDPLDRRITACSRSLASMATANQFVDDGSCR